MRSPLVIGVALVGLLAAGRGADAHPSLDWVGLELSPLAFNAGAPRENSTIQATPKRYSVAPGLTLRVGQHRWSSWYWTPGQLTFAHGDGRSASLGAEITLLALQTEGGFILAVGDHTVLEAGLAVGLGGLNVEVVFECDAACNLGGWGVMAAPVVRLSHRWEGQTLRSAGVFARAAIPLQGGTLGGPNIGFGVLFLFGVDVAFGFAAR